MKLEGYTQSQGSGYTRDMTWLNFHAELGESSAAVSTRKHSRTHPQEECDSVPKRPRMESGHGSGTFSLPGAYNYIRRQRWQGVSNYVERHLHLHALSAFRIRTMGNTVCSISITTRLRSLVVIAIATLDDTTDSLSLNVLL